MSVELVTEMASPLWVEGFLFLLDGQETNDNIDAFLLLVDVDARVIAGWSVELLFVQRCAIRVMFVSQMGKRGFDIVAHVVNGALVERRRGIPSGSSWTWSGSLA